MLVATIVLCLAGRIDPIYPPDRLTKVEAKTLIASAGRRWVFETRCMVKWDETGKYIDRYVRATCDGKVAWREQVGIDHPKHLPYGNLIKFAKVKVKATSPVLAIRGHHGMGQHWDTLFYLVQGKKLTLLGRPPARNSNGPTNYKGRANEWLFDDYDHYQHRSGDTPWHFVLYRLEGSKLKKIRSWDAKGKRAADTVGITDW